jgi:hypothetical protein
LHQSDLDQAQKNEWVAAIQGRGTPMSHFDYAGLLTETILLGNVAIREAQTKLEWDAANMKFPNHPDAEKWLSYDYRTGYSL